LDRACWKARISRACVSKYQGRPYAIETQKALPLIYRGVRIDCAYRVDSIVDSQVIVEVKAMQSLTVVSVCF